MRVIEVSEEVYELVLTIAKRKAKSVEEIILEYIARDIDPDVRLKST